MGGRGGGSSVSRERMLSDFNALMREQGRLGLEQQIQAAYQKLRGEGKGAFGGPSVYLDDLRAELATRGVTDRTAVDKALHDLGARHIAHFSTLSPAESWASPRPLPGSRQESISNASLRIGGENKQKIRFD